MVVELNFGVMVATTMESTEMGRSTERVFITGQTVLSTLESGNKTRCMAAVSSSGPMDVSTKANSIWV
jgi:hypothetical protein